MARLLPLVCLLLAAAFPAAAQQVVGGIPRHQPEIGVGHQPSEEQKESDRRVPGGEESPSPGRAHEPRLAEAQIRDDFLRLQLANNQVQASAARGAAQYQAMLKPLSEIRKCAKRLKTNLVLTAGKGAEEPPGPAEAESLEALLATLNESVRSFVRNPMFGSVKVFDVKQTKRAGADLARVIELSGVIADRLREGAR